MDTFPNGAGYRPEIEDVPNTLEDDELEKFEDEDTEGKEVEEDDIL